MATINCKGNNSNQSNLNVVDIGGFKYSVSGDVGIETRNDKVQDCDGECKNRGQMVEAFRGKMILFNVEFAVSH